MSEIKRLTETWEHEADASWVTIYRAWQNNLILEAMVSGMEQRLDKLCAVVYVGEVRGYIPLDFFGVSDAHQMRRYLGQTSSFKIVSYDREGETFIASRLDAMKHEAKLAWDRLQVGAKTTAIVRVVHRKAIQVEVSGIDVQIPVEEFGYGWFDDLRDHVEAGQELHVQVIKADAENEILNVSKKAVEKNPWPDCTKRFVKHAEYVGVVSGVAEYGVFVRLERGVDALVAHDRFQTLKKNSRVLIRVMNLDVEKERISGRIVRKL